MTMFGFVPQIIKIRKTKSVEDVSLFMLIQFAFGMLLWLLYGIHIQDPILIIANAVSFISLTIAIGLFFKYRENKI